MVLNINTVFPRMLFALNCICPLIVFAQQSGLNVYCVRPRIVFTRCSKCCACAIVIRKDNPLSGKVSFNRKVKSVWMVRKEVAEEITNVTEMAEGEEIRSASKKRFFM